MPQTHAILTGHPVWLNTSRALTPEDLRGRIILLDFWTYCCINCMHVIPDLHYLEEKFGNALTVIGVHSAKFANERDTGNIRDAILRYDITHPVVNDADFSIWRSFGVRAWPTFVLLTPEGAIADVWSGEGNRAAVERAVETLIRRYSDRINMTPLPLALEKMKQPDTVLRFPAKLAYTEEFEGSPALFISDSGHNRIVVSRPDGTIIATIGNGEAGFKDGNFTQTQFRHPQGIAYQAPLLYVADTENHALRVVDFSKKTVATLAGTGKQGYTRTARHAPARETSLSSPWDIAFYPDAQHLAIAMAGTHQLWSYDIARQTVSVLAGSGREDIIDEHASAAALAQTSGLAPVGGKLYFVDSETSSLRAFENGFIKTLIGTGLFDFGLKDGKQDTARMQHPLGVFADSTGIYIADSYNHAIRRFDTGTGILSTVITGLHEPNDVLRVGETLYIADTNNHAIATFDLSHNALHYLKAQIPFSLEFNEALPNLKHLPAATLRATKAVDILVKLQPGWKINHEAPSYAALFDMTEKEPKLIAGFDRAALEKKQFTLPPLHADKRYRLQGTFYYCEEKEGAQCLISSIDIPITAGDKGAGALAIPIE